MLVAITFQLDLQPKRPISLEHLAFRDSPLVPRLCNPIGGRRLLVYVVQFDYLNAHLIEPSGEGRWVRSSDAAKIRVVAGNFTRGRQA